jgi:hypothetical protein
MLKSNCLFMEVSYQKFSKNAPFGAEQTESLSNDFD